MTEHFVTIFDSLFLPQGLALHASLERHGGDFRLWVVCVDDLAYDMLRRLALPKCVPLRLTDLETDDLRRVRPTRSVGEYCWTLTPFAPRFVFEAEPSARRVTYLDADLWFLKHPGPLFAELERSGAQVLITDHGYAPEYDESMLFGQYCVQFVVFQRGGEPVRSWWQDRCVEWCYSRHEDGKFGDQKYLNDWPVRFPGLVHVLQQQQLTQAPWNATRFPVGQAVFFHFHSFRLIPGRRFDFGGGYTLPRPHLRHVYEPYTADMSQAIRKLEAAGLTVRHQSQPLGLEAMLRRIARGLRHESWRLLRHNVRPY